MDALRIDKLILLIISSFLLLSCSNQDDSAETISLWPEIEPFKTGFLKVSNIHEVYYELSGNPNGIPVFVIHGGPGVGCSPYMRRFFNPDKYLIVLHDQRGCGKSKPNAELRENTTQFLIEDIERLRIELNLNKIILFGGSWGSTLSLAYAEKYPENVSGMVLRGIFLCSKEEVTNIMMNVVPKFFPESYETLALEFPDYQSSYYPENWLERLQTENREDRKRNTKLYSRYEYKACGLQIEDEMLDKYYNSDENYHDIYTNALFEHYYTSHACFLEEGQLLRDVNKIQNIPITIINGRYDIICPPYTAYKLHKELSNSKLIIVKKAGHLMSEEGIEKALLEAAIEFE
jgi:proline iminopeptidase